MRTLKQHGLKILSALLVAAVALGGCGYSLSPSPYGLTTDLAVRVPVALNKSRYGELGPMLTSDVISRLDAAPRISVSEGALALLKLDITNVAITGGAWEMAADSDTPRYSASRVIHMTVEAILERPGPGGNPVMRRQTFSGYRIFLVSASQAQAEMRQAEAFQWLVSDLGQKISQTVFSEF